MIYKCYLNLVHKKSKGPFQIIRKSIIHLVHKINGIIINQM